jgi:hypothetical protein
LRRRLFPPDLFRFRELRINESEIRNFSADGTLTAWEASFPSQVKDLAQKEHSFNIAVLL